MEDKIHKNADILSAINKSVDAADLDCISPRELRRLKACLAERGLPNLSYLSSILPDIPLGGETRKGLYLAYSGEDFGLPEGVSDGIGIFTNPAAPRPVLLLWEDADGGVVLYVPEP